MWKRTSAASELHCEVVRAEPLDVSSLGEHDEAGVVRDECAFRNFALVLPHLHHDERATLMCCRMSASDFTYSLGATASAGPGWRLIAGGHTFVSAQMILRRGRPNLSASCWASASTTSRTRDWSCSRSCRSAILQEARRPNHPLAAAAAAAGQRPLQSRHDSLPPVARPELWCRMPVAAFWIALLRMGGPAVEGSCLRLELLRLQVGQPAQRKVEHALRLLR